MNKDPMLNLLPESERLGRDRLGGRLLHMTLARVQTSSLRQFLHQITGDPLLRQIVIARHSGCFNVAMMGRAAHRAMANAQVHAHEKNAVFTAALIARLGDMAHAWVQQGVPSGAWNWTGPGSAPELQRRWQYFLGSAWRGLQSSDPQNAALVGQALGLAAPEGADDLHGAGARLQTAVSLGWTQACSRSHGYRLARAQSAGFDKQPTTSPGRQP
jgi:hypothetical protein